MFNLLGKRVWILAGVGGAALAATLFTHDATRAQEEAPAILIGTFEPATVAQESGLQAKMQAGLQEKMQGLQQRAQAAQQSGDQAAMQQIQSEAQQIQNDAMQEFQDTLDTALPDVAKAAGVQIIAVQYAYTAPGIETKDLTAEITEALSTGEPAGDAATPDTPQAQ